MPAIHEMYGIQAERLENQLLEYGKLLGLVARIKSGEVDPETVVIEDSSWRIEPAVDKQPQGH